MIEAHIVNVGWLHAGIPHGEQINFPADFETVQARLRKINALDGRHEIALSEYRSDIPGLAKRLDPYENLDELNYLAHLLTDMESADREKFAAAVAHGEYANSLEGLINLAYNLECYDLHRGINDTEDLGRLRAEGRVELPEDCRHYFDYASYGEDIAINEGGEFADAGYIHNNRTPFTRRYNGLDVPDEYRVFAAPEPPEKMPIMARLDMYEKQAGAAPDYHRPAPEHTDRADR